MGWWSGFHLILLVGCFGLVSVRGKVIHKLHCSNNTMKVELSKTDEVSAMYLYQLKDFPDPSCQPVIDGLKATFHLSLADFSRCGTTRVTNRLTGQVFYYHRIVVEYVDKKTPKDVVLVKCDGRNVHSLAKRDILPAGFQEPEVLEISTEVTGEAPVPVLGIGVRQNGRLIGTELNVLPGTPLLMEIYLDNTSAPTYGLLVSQMQVTDNDITRPQKEVIILNGCSVDPNLFENFQTDDGDILRAKFRAFKFPGHNYVQFQGTVIVCIDKCEGIDCSNEQKGYGRRRRDTRVTQPNRVFEEQMTIYISVANSANEDDSMQTILGNDTLISVIDNQYVLNQEADEQRYIETPVAQQTGPHSNSASFHPLACFVVVFMSWSSTLLS